MKIKTNANREIEKGEHSYLLTEYQISSLIIEITMETPQNTENKPAIKLKDSTPMYKKDTGTLISLTVLFTIGKVWNQPR